MTVAQTLIDKALEMCGADAEVARRLEIDRAEITRLRKGTRPLSPELAAEIADIAGEDARQAAIDAIIERNEKNRKGPLLREILGKNQAAGGAAMCHIYYSGDLVNATDSIDIAAMKTRPLIYSMVSQIISVIKSKVYRASFLQAKKQALAFG